MYFPHVPVDNTAEIVFVEKYADQEAFDAHFQTPYFKALAEKFCELLDGEPILQTLKELV